MCVCVYVQAITPISLPRVSVVDLFPNFVMKRAEEKTDSRATRVHVKEPTTVKKNNTLLCHDYGENRLTFAGTITHGL